MPELSDLSFMAKDFKCFGKPQGFRRIQPINVIVGRNNSGKSSLLDLIDVAFGELTPGMGHQGRSPMVYVEWRLTEADIQSLPQEYWTVRQNDLTHEFSARGWTWRCGDNARARLAVHGSNPEVAPMGQWSDENLDRLKREKIAVQFAHRVGELLQGYRVHRLAAERDVKPEPPVKDAVNEIVADGTYATQMVQDLISFSDRQPELIESELRDELNEIFWPDSYFNRIQVRSHRSGQNEIYVEEEHKGRIPLSRMGSGFKTVLLVLLNLIVLPAIASDDSKRLIYLFEELENNLHPSLQRRLFQWIRSRVVAEGHHVFVTTHSTAVVDVFAHDSQARILHVEHDGESATIRTTAGMADSLAILDDLGIKASDILQANAVIWVEGPSDRIYLNRWIELWSDGELSEGVHYQCVFFGGSLNAHLSLDDPDVQKHMVQGMRLSPHAALLIDRDRDDDVADLKEHTQRLVDEVDGTGGYSWVTAGREVENYIPSRVIGAMLENPNIRGPKSEFRRMIEYLAQKGVKDSKVVLARRVAAQLEKDDLEHLDLGQRLEELCQRIRDWNHME